MMVSLIECKSSIIYHDTGQVFRVFLFFAIFLNKFSTRSTREVLNTGIGAKEQQTNNISKF